MQLQAKSYQYKATADAHRNTFGFIAQEVEKIFPEFIFKSEDGIKGIAYRNFSVIAIKAIQEQQELIINLEKKNQELEQQFQQQVNTLIQRIEALEKKSR
jgi:trimeric autotransporter adhesin